MEDILEKQREEIVKLATNFRNRMGSPWFYEAELKARFCTDTICTRRTFEQLRQQIIFKMPTETIKTPAIFKKK